VAGSDNVAVKTGAVAGIATCSDAMNSAVSSFSILK
jgi:hypothetical protein